MATDKPNHSRTGCAAEGDVFEQDRISSVVGRDMNSDCKLLHGDCLEQLKTLEPNSVDSLVTDPPAGISFMGKDWDSDKGGRQGWIAWMTEVMTECMRVMKPGAHGLVWAIPRTSHWTATALEDAGFEVRDVVTHLFGSGFPKSLDISKAIDKAAGAEREILGPNKFAHLNGKANVNTFAAAKRADETAPATDAAKQWQGWGTALKPASEHWILIRKPCSEKTVAANVLKWGTGAINIDASRVAGQVPKPFGRVHSKRGVTPGADLEDNLIEAPEPSPLGRFPANLVLDEEAAMALDEQSGTLKSGGGDKGNKTVGAQDYGSNSKTYSTDDYAPNTGGASRFFYVAKASKVDKGADNTHPTVKSQKLMQYLIKMITPPNGVVLDPFMGSGSTGVACKNLGRKFIGIEMDANYFSIAKRRIDACNLQAEFK
jgi:DNA modification methylase